MNNLKIYLFFILPLVAFTAMAQRVKTVEGYACMVQSEDQTAAEIKAQVVKGAKIEALIEAFGSNISQINISRFINDNGKDASSFYMLEESDLRGTWIRDLNRPRLEKHIEDGEIVWEAWVKGEASEVTRAKVEFDWKLLANGTDNRHQVEELFDGDAFYVKFCSPVKGYLIIFMVNEKDVVSCILPEEGKDYCTVEANKWQLFYSVPGKPENHWVATITNGRQEEMNRLYILFSPNKIAPPIRVTNQDNSDLERYYSKGKKVTHVPELKFEEFHKYLGNLLKRDSEVQYEKMLVKISKRKI